MFPIACVYLGFVTVLIGVVALVRPLPALGLVRRARGAALLLIGLLLVAAGISLPAPDMRITAPRSRLDEFAPVYQFNEVHTTRVLAPPADVFRAISKVTAEEIRLFKTLTWIRRFGRQGPESILNTPQKTPMLEVVTRTTFLLLAQEQDRELVIGTVVISPPAAAGLLPRTPEAFRTLTQPGFATATMNFLIQPDGLGNSLVSTETRVFASDAATRRRFARYWRVIYPGSAIIRRSWLRAIRRRAEGAMAGSGGASDS